MSKGKTIFLSIVTAGAIALAWTTIFADPPSVSAQGAGEKPDRISFAILFGVGQQEPQSWDGSIEASGARVTRLEGWRFAENDQVSGHSWKLSTRRVVLTRGVGNGDSFPALENGVYVTAEVRDAAARFSIKTEAGDFDFAANEVRYGAPLKFLDGRAAVERTPPYNRLTDSVEEQDFPAATSRNGKVYLAYVEFTHGDRSQEWPRQLRTRPTSFEPLRRPAGGDQVLLREYSTATGEWTAPQAVTPKGQDVYKTAVAVDGQDRLWVIWSAQVDGNFDIYARARQNGSWASPVRVTNHASPDLSPAAATDADGAVWIAWQGYRDNFEILVARQQGERFSSEQRVSFSPANDWAPQIAAGSSGVAVSWDTYDKGDYDVYVRRLSYSNGIRLAEPQAVAASPNFEARSTLAFDNLNRLWVAYEESFPRWGKDFGAYETTGTGLYQGNTVRVRVLQGEQMFSPGAGLEAVLDARPAANPLNRGPVRYSQLPVDVQQPDPSLAGERPMGIVPYPVAAEAKESYPRLAADQDGNVFLAYRTSAGRIWGGMGTVWFEHLARFSGKEWSGPVFLPESDGILDSRPALAATGAGKLLIVGANDGRFTWAGSRGRQDGQDFDSDLTAWEFEAGGGAAEAELTRLRSERASRPIPAAVTAEIQQVKKMRDYRVRLGNETLQLMRGEFHRHTSISVDGGSDGDIIDAWRYMLDAAYMDWVGCCDHDNGNGREYTWWLTQKMTDAFHVPGKFVPLFNYERSVRYPEGHRNVLFAQRGIRALPRLPKTADDSPSMPAPDTQMLYDYLRTFDGVTAVHTSGTNMGTDWRDNDPKVEPFVEIYQGDRQNYEIPGGPRANTEQDSIGGWQPLGFVSLALEKGYRLAFQASSDHMSTHMSYCNVWVDKPTRESLMEGFRKRRVYGATDNILADVRCSGHFMGEEFAVREPPRIEVKLNGTAKFARVQIIKDGRYVYSAEPSQADVSFSWRDAEARKGATSYYYVRGEQEDGEIVWASPMWITLQ